MARIDPQVSGRSGALLYGCGFREGQDHFVFFGEKHVRHVLREYERHYNTERPHQGLGNKPLGDWPEPAPAEVIRLEDIVCEERLGGLLKSYRRAA